MRYDEDYVAGLKARISELEAKLSKPEWVGLTDDEIGEIKQTSPIYVSAKAVNAIVPMVEAKLKEKNA